MSAHDCVALETGTYLQHKSAESKSSTSWRGSKTRAFMTDKLARHSGGWWCDCEDTCACDSQFGVTFGKTTTYHFEAVLGWFGMVSVCGMLCFFFVVCFRFGWVSDWCVFGLVVVCCGWVWYVVVFWWCWTGVVCVCLQYDCRFSKAVLEWYFPILQY